MSSLTLFFRLLSSVGRGLLGLLTAGAPGDTDDTATRALLDAAEAARQAGRTDEAAARYQQVLDRHRHHVGALRGLRDLALADGRWPDAIELQQRVLAVVPAGERAREAETLAVCWTELGKLELGAGRPSVAIGSFKSALRADRTLVAAALALGDAYEASGDHREAVRTWERAAAARPALPLLERLEEAYHRDGRPARMIELYREAIERVPDDPALAIALARVYLELEMLDEAADQLEKLEVRAPDAPVVHALLGTVFERRGDTREAFDEYRRAIRLTHGFDWPFRCGACDAVTPGWRDRCPACGRWNTLVAART